jgi:thiol-disulfide isomerase/thioredoxin
MATDLFKYTLILENADFDASHKLKLTDPQGLLQGKVPRRVLVLMYSDSCPHCVTTKPEFAKAAKALHGSDILPVAIPLEGPDVDKALAQRVQSIFPDWSGGIPFIATIDTANGAIRPFQQSRKGDAIVAFAKA